MSFLKLNYPKSDFAYSTLRKHIVRCTSRTVLVSVVWGWSRCFFVNWFLADYIIWLAVLPSTLKTRFVQPYFVYSLPIMFHAFITYIMTLQLLLFLHIFRYSRTTVHCIVYLTSFTVVHLLCDIILIYLALCDVYCVPLMGIIYMYN